MESWQEVENMITMIDPQFKELGGQITKKPEVATAGDLKKVLIFLRTEVGAMLLNNEALQREKQGLFKMLQDQGNPDEKAG